MYIRISIRIHILIISVSIIIGISISLNIRIHITEWLRLCRRPLLSTHAISYCLLVTSERCLEGGRDRNGAPADFVFISY